MRTTLFEIEGRQSAITTAPRNVGFRASWHCLKCNAEGEVPGHMATREEAQIAAESLATRHVCVTAPTER